MNSHSKASIQQTVGQDEQFDSSRGATAARLFPAAAFGARAAVLAGVVATACATAAPAASTAVSTAVSTAAPATHMSVTVTLNGPGGGFITPADSTCCM